MNIKNLLTIVLLMLGMSTVSAALSSGYYRIKSNAYSGRYIGENTAGGTLYTATGIDGSDYTCVWYLEVSGNSVTIKNAVTDHYVQHQGTASALYIAASESATFTMAEPSTGIYTFSDNNDGWGMHCSASQSYDVVHWLTSSDPNKWQVEAAEVNSSELAAQKANLAEATTSQLTAFFTTTACTALNSTYSSYSDADLRSAMSALPTSVQDLAIKVKKNGWTTYSGWDKTEKTFRIADYKAYSNVDRWTSLLGLKYTFGRLENPTGIYVEKGDYLQVYVGEIPTGETVRLAVASYGAGGSGGPGISYYALHEGMNSVKMTCEGNCFVIYEVDNTTGGGAPYTALSNYADVTVHIEGGTVQGYFDLTKGYTNSDWTQLKSHLMSKNMFCMKTKTLTFNLQTDLVKTAVDGGGGNGSTGEMVEMLEYWQRIQDMEDEIFNRSSIGGENYKYCNNIHTVSTIGDSGAGLLYAFTNGIYFSPEQHNRLFNNKLFREGSDNLWACAHELGHHRQGPINMVGNTEVSNNIFSNVAVYMQGRHTSRTASLQETFRDYINGVSWPERVKRSNNSVGNYNQQLLHLNWQLYQFFHINGNKSDFFPRLFTALREDPMSQTAGADALTPAESDYLKYYVKCCEASGYDLTDFFAAYGFFMLPPVQATPITYNGVTTDRYQTFVDYATYNLYVTQEMIDAAKATVAAKSLPKCNIVFIEDRVSAPDATYEGHAEGEKKTLNDACSVTAFGQVGETGQYTDFGATCSSYTYNVTSQGKVKMVGSGAVGFIVYDNSGNIIGFYNTNTFDLPSGASNYSIKAAAGDGTTASATKDTSIEVKDDVEDVISMGEKITAESQLVSGKLYLLRNTATGNPWIADAGTYYSVPDGGGTLDEKCMYYLIKDGNTWKIKNYYTGKYWGKPTAASTADQGGFVPTDEAGAGSWSLNFNANGNIDPQCNGFYINRASQKLHAWSSSLSSQIYEIGLTYPPFSELTDKDVRISSDAAASLQTGKWYVMFDRGANHGYLYENNSNQLYNTSTVPSGSATGNAKYLVRIVGWNKEYYLQTGLGHFFGKIEQSTTVPTTTAPTEQVSIHKIAGTDGHFYLTSADGIVLDANACYTGDATVVGWSSNAPTSTGGNNDWAFYPVEFVDSWIPEEQDVKIVSGLTGEADLGSWSGSTWTSASSGLTLTLSDGSHDKFSNYNDRYNMAYHPAEANTNATLTLTAPEGYIITGYSVETGVFQAQTYTLTPEDGTPITPANLGNTYTLLAVTGLSTTSTAITVTTTDASKWLCLANFTVTLAKEYPINLTPIRGKSYATLYLPFGITLLGDVKAYKIAVSGEWAVPTEMGQQLPANTAALLVSESAVTSALAFGNSAASADAAGNLLEGTLMPGYVDGYVLNIVDDCLGFYKLDDTGRLAANRAYLPASAVDGAGVKGVLLNWGDADGIEAMDNGQSSMVNGQCFDLSGRRISSASFVLPKGIYIVNGKKKVIK